MDRRQSSTGNESVADLESIENKAVLLDALPHCVFLIGPDHTILTVNSTVDALLGDAAPDIVGKSLRSAMAPLEDAEGESLDVDTPVDRCLVSGEAELLDAWLRPDDRNSASSDKELNKITVTVLPISTQDADDRVAVMVGGDAVRQSYSLRDAVLSMVSHELRTPLLHIKGFVSTLLESDIQWDEETRLDFLHTIDREADRLTSMVNDLMEITRMGSVDLPLHREDADPYLLAYAAIDSASPFIRKHRVLVEIPEKLPKINIDVLRVMGVLANLLQNASKYSEDGSKIVIDAETDDSYVTFSVTDEGVGISEDMGHRIFNMFYRGEDAAKRSPGSGLGLAVCRSVVGAHGGRIWVESEIGKGATFKFTIPLTPIKKIKTKPENLRKASNRPAKGQTRSSKATKTASRRRSKTVTAATKPTRKRKTVAAR